MASLNVPALYIDALQRVKHGVKEKSRNGPVLTSPRPEMFTVINPTQRVLFHPERKANPYFHVMETVWMLAGMASVKPLLPFNSRMGEYADNGIINGAYGFRWRHHFAYDQIWQVINLLKKEPYSRQAVIAMWDPDMDGPHAEVKDRPCNTHLYFRRVDGCLDMTVCNRSNDAVWGMAGANAVHMTYLQEFIAFCLNWPVGYYHVMTNNLHVYEHHWPLLECTQPYNLYVEEEGVRPYPLLSDKCDPQEFLYECSIFMRRPKYKPQSRWLRNVALPMREIYLDRKGGEDQSDYVYESIAAPDWRRACELWGEWHDE